MSAIAIANPAQAPRVARVGTSLSLNLILRNQMSLVAERGYTICCICEDDEWARELRELGFEVWPLGLGRRPGPLAAAAWGLALYRRLRETPVDILHTHNAFHGIVGRIAARLAGTPVVVQTVHNWWYLAPDARAGGRLRAAFYRLLERVAAGFSDRLFFINADDFAFAASAGVTRPEKRLLIGNGIDTAAFLAEHGLADRARIREELGLPTNGVVVVMVARLEPPKDHETLLQAIRGMAPERPELRLLLVGYGMHEARIRRRVDELGLSDRVVFTGYRADVPAVLAAADVLVLTSRQEGFGRCLVEGMLAEIPVIGTDVVGVRDVIADGENGLLIPGGDPGALTAALTRVLDDREFTAGLVLYAREQALERFDERLPASRVADAYDELLRAARARRGSRTR